jgi:hypothetical protein
MLLVCLLVPFLAAAVQPSIGPEITSEPLPTRMMFTEIAAPAVAMARDRQGVAIAWTMRNASRADAVYVARINGAGHIIGTAVEIPITPANGDVDAHSPSIAVSPTGVGFTIAWTEWYRAYSTHRGGRVMVCHLDESLNPSAPRTLTLLSQAAKASPAIVRSGKGMWIASGNSVWPIGENGLAAQPLDAGAPVSDMVANADFPRLVSGRGQTTGYECKSIQGCLPIHWWWVCPESCRIYKYAFAVRFTALYSASTLTSFPFQTMAQPAIASHGQNVLIAWLHGDQATGGTVNAAFTNVASDLQSAKVLGRFGSDTGATRPDIATDGDRYVIVWRTTSPLGDHDIAGAMIDRAGTITDFSIATSHAEERDPSVLAIGNDTFLVAYEKIENGERRIAGRFVKFVGRRRAA